MKIREPMSHWNNFTVPELKEILGHCNALERLGIAQDEEMTASIERDISLREQKIRRHHLRRSEQIIRKTTQHTKKQSQDYLLAQPV